ncbi:MAG TPA: hypothetical protein VFV49_08545 [Thermoanaerobaculia bacterium]|nr:hypothetical protein [Thermoanaerobaculia bacterium]
MTAAPRAAFGSFDHIHEIYYTTDDGFAELHPREEPRHDAAHVAGLYEIFERYEEFHRRVAPERRDRIHLASVVGGLYGLNLIPLFRPREITFFDVNPHAVSYFNIIRRVWIDSADADAFLGRLTNADYDVHTAQEEVIRRCIAAKQHGTLVEEEEGRSARSFLSSWRYALDHFELTRTLLAEVPVHTRVQAMHSESFKEFVAGGKDLWIYCSNVFLFVFFDLTFRFPENAALFASYFDKTEMLDVASAGRAPVTVHCSLPMSISAA